MYETRPQMMKRHAHKVKAEVNCLPRALKSCCVLKQAEKSASSGMSHLETHLPLPAYCHRADKIPKSSKCLLIFVQNKMEKT